MDDQEARRPASVRRSLTLGGILVGLLLAAALLQAADREIPVVLWIAVVMVGLMLGIVLVARFAPPSWLTLLDSFERRRERR